MTTETTSRTEVKATIERAYVLGYTIAWDFATDTWEVRKGGSFVAEAGTEAEAASLAITLATSR